MVQLLGQPGADLLPIRAAWLGQCRAMFSNSERVNISKCDETKVNRTTKTPFLYLPLSVVSAHPHLRVHVVFVGQGTPV